MQQLRPYQVDALSRLAQAFREGHRKMLLVSPVGSGKTTCFGHLTQKFVRAGRKVLVLVHRKELLDQASARLDGFGVPHGVIMANHPRKAPLAPVQVASIQTLNNRPKPVADLVIVDEAHRARAATWSSVLDFYPAARICGFTATPWRLDGKGLGDLFEDVVVAVTAKELVAAGYLAPVTGFGYDRPDLKGVKTSRGEYNEKQLASVMSKTPIIGNIIEQWQKYASDLSTVVFAVNVEHSKLLTSQFVAAGVRAEHIDGTMGKTEREAILARVASGETQVVCNVNVLTEGTDIPRLKCCILARPTKSLSLYIQSGGRVRRPFEGITARVHDHAGCLQMHGLPDADRNFSLTLSPKKRPALDGLRTCAKCRAVYEPGIPACPACGYAPVPGSRGKVEHVLEGDLLEFDNLEFQTVTLFEEDITAREHWASLWSKAKIHNQPRWMAISAFKRKYKRDPCWQWEYQG